MCVENSVRKRNDTVLAHMGLVRAIAARFTGRGTDLEDLVQIGTVGLIRAAEKFDPAFGTKFSTYAVPQILGELKQHFRDDGPVKVSRSYRKTAADIAAYTKEFQNTHGRSPTLSEISAALQTEREKVAEIICSAKSVLSFSAPIPGGDSTLAECVPAPETLLETTEILDLHRALKTLSSRERKLIFLRYIKEKSQRETGISLGVSQVQVSRLEKNILHKMQEMIKA